MVSAPFLAPHFGSLWQSDLNLMLARYGLGLAAIYDMKSRTLVCLDPIDNKLTASLWLDVHLPAVLRQGGFPDKWSTDKGTET